MRRGGWRFIGVIAVGTSFVLGLAGCFARGWRAPPPEIIAFIYALGILLGVVTAWARAGALPPLVVPPAAVDEDLVHARAGDGAVLVASGVLGGATAAAGAVLVATAINDLRSLFVASLIGSLWMATYPLHVVGMHALIERAVVVGVDGLRVGRRRLAFREIRGAVVAPGQRAVHVERDDGTRLLLPCRTHAAAEALAVRISERLAAPADVAVLRTRLARAGRTLAEWRRALASTDYRSSEVSHEDAMRVLSSGTATPDERIGAALVLGARLEEGRVHVRIVAAQCLEPRLRAALEAVANGELEEQRILALENPRVFRKKRRGAGER